jgi:hypothetical protein
VLIGAATGASIAAITGNDIATGALTGAVSAAAFYGAGTLIEGIRVSASMAAVTEAGATNEYAMAAAYQQSVSSLGAASIHAGAGVVSGGVNAAITGSDIGMGALTGGISGGIASGAGNYIPDDFASQFAGRSFVGGITGGITTELSGGDFGEGFVTGAWTAGYAYTFNCSSYRLIQLLEKGGHRVLRYLSKKEAIQARRAGHNVVSETRSEAKALEIAANNGDKTSVRRDIGHSLRNGDTECLIIRQTGLMGIRSGAYRLPVLYSTAFADSRPIWRYGCRIEHVV